jgi:hypothetical protein
MRGEAKMGGGGFTGPYEAPTLLNGYLDIKTAGIKDTFIKIVTIISLKLLGLEM